MSVPMMLRQQYNLTSFEKVLLIQLPPQMTVVEAPHFRELFLQWVSEYQNISTIIFDFGNTQFLDSSGIGALVTNFKTCKTHNLKLKFWGLTEPIKMAFELAGLDSIFEIDPHSDGLDASIISPNSPRPALTHPSVRSRWKRRIDIIGSIVGLGITSVLLVPIAIAIKLSAPGPIFFSQERCGLMGRRFKIWKFRSMVVNAEDLKKTVKNDAEGAIFKNTNDPRITPVGKFIRKTSLDELPQFWNVLKGDMSLIGTRPPIVSELDEYEILNWQRFDVKPGMSGEWQVNGRSSVTNFEDVIKLDLQYQKNWSLIYDINLLLKTILVVFTKNSGAA